MATHRVLVIELNITERLMRAFLIALAAVFVAGCAAAPAKVSSGDKVAVYDHRNNVTRYVDRPAESDFVGTSAKAQATKKKPAWYDRGHP
jgi:hypothetical protein